MADAEPKGEFKGTIRLVGGSLDGITMDLYDLEPTGEQRKSTLASGTECHTLIISIFGRYEFDADDPWTARYVDEG